MSQTTVAAKPAKSTIEAVDAATLRGWLQRGEAVLVDVREPREHACERIPGAASVPLSSLTPEQIPVDQAKRLVLHCHSGARAVEAAKRLLDSGVEHLWCFEGGVDGWREAGYEVEGSGKQHLSVQRQTQLVIGGGVLLGTLLGVFVAPAWLLLPGFMGCGLLLAGSTGRCPLANAIAKLPYNQGNCACGVGQSD